VYACPTGRATGSPSTTGHAGRFSCDVGQSARLWAVRGTANLPRPTSGERAIPANGCLDAVNAAPGVALNVVLPTEDDEPSGVAQPPEAPEVTPAVVLFFLLPIRCEPRRAVSQFSSA